MKRIIITALALFSVSFAVGCVGYTSFASAASRHCGSRFVQNSDAGVANVRATFVTCPDAVRFAFGLDLRPHSSLHGFRCHYTPAPYGLYHTDVRCTRGRQRISFEAY